MDNQSRRASDDPMKLSLELLKEITDGFADERILGSGTFGVVYKGVYTNGEVIAVKKLPFRPGIDNKEFTNELELLKTLSHQNIVKLLGFCDETEVVDATFDGRIVRAHRIYRALCLEFAPNGSLREFLSGQHLTLDWHLRFEIIKGICEGLNYLQEISVMHCDLKLDNILINGNLMPKIADFGQSMKLKGEGNIMTMKCTVGTLGYSPPEFITKKIISKEYDIYSLGVIIKKIMTGMMANISDMGDQECIDHVHNYWRKKFEDIPSYASLEVDCKQVRTSIEIAVACMEEDRCRRPTIKDIVGKFSKTESKKNYLRSQEQQIQDTLSLRSNTDHRLPSPRATQIQGPTLVRRAHAMTSSSLRKGQSLEPSQIYRRSSCSSFFIPTGSDSFNIFRIFGKCKVNHEVQFQPQFFGEISDYCGSWLLSCFRSGDSPKKADEDAAKMPLLSDTQSYNSTFTSAVTSTSSVHSHGTIVKPEQSNRPLPSESSSQLQTTTGKNEEEIKPSLIDFNVTSVSSVPSPTSSTGSKISSGKSETEPNAGTKLIKIIDENKNSLANSNGGLDIPNGSMSGSNVHEIKDWEEEYVTQGKLNIEEYDLEKFLDEQETHHMYCPNCNSCITRRVILKKRKRTCRKTFDESSKKPHVAAPCSDAPSQTAADMHEQESPDIFRCLSCFSFFLPIGCGFNLFRLHGKRDVKTEVQVEDPSATEETYLVTGHKVGQAVPTSEDKIESPNESKIVSETESTPASYPIKDTTSTEINCSIGATTEIPSSADPNDKEKKSPRRSLARELPFEFLRDITDGFSAKRKVSDDAFGTVYKGILHSGEEISVLTLQENSPLIADRFYNNEIGSLMGIEHENIVQLFGFCCRAEQSVVQHEGNFFLADVVNCLLCYEYVPKGSLDKYLYGECCGLDWNVRFKIIMGICQGLHFLHEKLDRPIIHMNLAPENILLDESMAPKLSHFFLSRLFGQEQAGMVTVNVVGICGYLAPEYLSAGQFSTKTDIYSLGLLIIEIATGEQNSRQNDDQAGRNFIENVRQYWTDEYIASKHPSLGAHFLRQINACIEIGLKCVEMDPEGRPSIGEIVSTLLGSHTGSMLDKDIASSSSDSRSHLIDNLLRDVSIYQGGLAKSL